MSTTRIRIDLTQGVVEAEGTEAFVQSIYADFKERVEAITSAVVSPPKKRTPQKKSSDPEEPKLSKGKRTKKGRRIPKIAGDLDLSGGKKGQSLRDFAVKYVASSNFERNLVFVYYLHQVAVVTPITIDQVFTCYRNLPGVKVPGNLEQSLIDTRAHKGWIDTTSLDDLKVTIPGINYLEHDMKKAGPEDA